jgi:hypothetical protein
MERAPVSKPDEDIESFLLENGTDAQRLTVVTLFAKNMLRELTRSIAEWEHVVEALEQAKYRIAGGYSN